MYYNSLGRNLGHNNYTVDILARIVYKEVMNDKSKVLIDMPFSVDSAWSGQKPMATKASY